MKVSTRGAIRKAPSAISWVYSIINLSGGKAIDPGNLIKQWTLGLLIGLCFGVGKISEV